MKEPAKAEVKPNRPAEEPIGAEQTEAAEKNGAPGRAPQINKEPLKPAEESPSQEQKRQATSRKTKAREKSQVDRTLRHPEAGKQEERKKEPQDEAQTEVARQWREKKHL